MKSVKLRLLSGAAFGLSLMAFHGSAQAAPAEQSGDSPTTALDEIVVTAQKRSESAQTVPISVQSFSADILAKSRVSATEDLTLVVGGLLVQPTAARPAIFLRGVGGNSSNTTPAVLTFIDGVYQPFGTSTDLNNIASMEVLKGPQGTLFGRNATGGVIQITTKDPMQHQGVTAEIGYGNYNTIEGSFYGATKLANNLAADLAVKYSNQMDGFGTNIFNGNDIFKSKRYSARTKWVYEASDAVRLTLSADYMQVTGQTGTNTRPAVGYGFLFLEGAIRTQGSSYFPGSFDVNADYGPGYKSKEYGTSLTVDVDLGGSSLRSITAYRHNAEDIKIDYDGTPKATFDLDIQRQPREAVTQELQLLSKDSGRFKWVVGAFYYNAIQRINPWTFFGTTAEAAFGLNPGGRYEIFARDSSNSLAAYGQASYEVFDKTKLTLGGRYTMEERAISGYINKGGLTPTGIVPGTTGSLSKTFKVPTYRIALDHQFTPDMLAYVSYSKGFNSGFYNQGNTKGFASETANPLVQPEYIKSYEAGLKTDWLDRRLRINLAGFLYDYTNLQQQIYSGGSVITINAAAAKIKGIDFEVMTRPIPSLTVALTGTYLDAKYKSYPSAPSYIYQPNGSLPSVGAINAAGNNITNTPEWSYTISATHSLPTSIGEFSTTANLNYRGKTYNDPGNLYTLPTRYVLNMTERWTSLGEHFSISVWAKNLLDKRYDYAINILAPAGLVGSPAPPRTYGISAGFKF